MNRNAITPENVGGRLAAFIRAEFPHLTWWVPPSESPKVWNAVKRKWPRLWEEMEQLRAPDIDLRLALQVSGVPLETIDHRYAACKVCAELLYYWPKG